MQTTAFSQGRSVVLCGGMTQTHDLWKQINLTAEPPLKTRPRSRKQHWELKEKADLLHSLSSLWQMFNTSHLLLPPHSCLLPWGKNKKKKKNTTRQSSTLHLRLKLWSTVTSASGHSPKTSLPAAAMLLMFLLLCAPQIFLPTAIELQEIKGTDFQHNSASEWGLGDKAQLAHNKNAKENMQKST